MLGVPRDKEAIVLAVGMAVTAAIVLAFAIGGMVFGDLGHDRRGRTGNDRHILRRTRAGNAGPGLDDLGLCLRVDRVAGDGRRPRPVGQSPGILVDGVGRQRTVHLCPLGRGSLLGYGAATILPFGTLFWMFVFVFVLFPILFLSALDEQFWLGFASVRVYKSLSTVRRAWGVLYLYQLVLAILLAAAVGIGRLVQSAMVGSSSWIIGVNVIAFCVAARRGRGRSDLCPRALGRLVWVISETEKAIASGDEDDAVEEPEDGDESDD